MSVEIEIYSRKYWYKLFDNMQHTTAIISKTTNEDMFTIYFFGGACGSTTNEAFDELSFRSFEEAVANLEYNGFISGREDKHGYCKLHSPVYRPSEYRNNIYSSGKYWRSL